MCSGGLRRGAIPKLRIRDLQKIEKYSLYKVSVYKKEAEAYTAFLTPECTRHLDQYFEWRAVQGEKLTDASPVIRKTFSSLNVARPQAISNHGIDWLINNLLHLTRSLLYLCSLPYVLYCLHPLFDLLLQKYKRELYSLPFRTSPRKM
jgi:hypothetical protein